MGHYGHPTGCACDRCNGRRAIARASQRRYRARARAGDHTHRDPQVIVEHVEALIAMGCKRQWIAAAAGLNPNSLLAIMQGHRRYVAPATAAALLTVTARDVFAHTSRRETALLPVCGSQRRLQALSRMGHPLRALSAHIGLHPRNVDRIIGGRQAVITVRTARRINAVYDALWNVPGPSQICRDHAAHKSWPPPLAWDDDAIDDPGALPQLGDRSPRTLALAEDAAELLAQDIPLAVVAERLSVHLPTLKQAIHRARKTACSRATAAA